MAVANEAPCSWLGYGVWSTPCTCFISSLWDVANPRTTLPIFQTLSNQTQIFLFHVSSCTVFAIWLIRTGKSFEQGRRKISFAQFLISNHQNRSCQVYWGVFCTYDAFHISNSIRYFWASVCVCVCNIWIDVKLLSFPFFFPFPF